MSDLCEPPFSWLPHAIDNLSLIHSGDGEDPARPETVQAMALVLNMPKSAPPNRADLLEASAIASLQVCLCEEAASNPAWEGALKRWYGARIRKIARRARTAGQWEKVQAVPGKTVDVRGSQVRAFVPTSVGAVDPRIGKLQIQGTDLETDEDRPTRDCPLIVIDSDLSMTVGKAAAQVGHGAMLWASGASPEDLAAWLECPSFDIREWPAEEIREAKNAAVQQGISVVEIHDAGYTEVAPGSTTVTVFGSSFI